MIIGVQRLARLGPPLHAHYRPQILSRASARYKLVEFFLARAQNSNISFRPQIAAEEARERSTLSQIVSGLLAGSSGRDKQAELVTGEPEDD